LLPAPISQEVRFALPTDVTQPEACQQLIEKALTAFGQIDSLINNAGISMLSPL
jgi:NADP-dependent 3-hydroxy acid dehydrogenase YdfG